MAEALKDDALTTVARVKERLQIDKTTLDAVILRFINSVTAQAKRVMGVSNLKRRTITNELVTADDQYLLLKAWPLVSVTSVEYASGNVGSYTFTPYETSHYEIIGNGADGMIYSYAGFPEGNNMVRVTYVAGYLIDWDNVTDTTKHTLPDDLTDWAERKVTRLLKKREAEGKISEGAAGSSVTWEKEFLTAEDIAYLQGYSQPMGVV